MGTEILGKPGEGGEQSKGVKAWCGGNYGPRGPQDSRPGDRRQPERGLRQPLTERDQGDRGPRRGRNQGVDDGMGVTGVSETAGELRGQGWQEQDQ